VVRLDRNRFLHLTDRYCGASRDERGQLALVRRVQVRDHHEGETTFGRHGPKQLLQCIQATRRRLDADDRKISYAVPSRQYRTCGLMVGQSILVLAPRIRRKQVDGSVTWRSRQVEICRSNPSRSSIVLLDSPWRLRSGGRAARRDIDDGAADSLHDGIAFIAFHSGAEEQGVALVDPEVPVAGAAKGSVDVALEGERSRPAPIVSSAACQLCEELAGLQNADGQLVPARQQMIVVADEHAISSSCERGEFAIRQGLRSHRTA
jgi:hypothetical protein